MSYESSKEGRLKLDIFNNDDLDEAKRCRQYPTVHEVATLYDMEYPSAGEPTSTRTTSDGGGGSSSTADGGGESVAGAQGTKRKRSVYPFARRSGVTPLLLPGQLPSGADREVSSVPRVEAGTKVEVTAPSPTHGGAGMGGV
ncbi:unnamed protein product [Sphacelaria rigidula]